jgi:hypothetical protein
MQKRNGLGKPQVLFRQAETTAYIENLLANLVGVFSF